MQYFGENPKQSQPNTVFSVLQRFVDGFRVSEEDFQLMQLLTGPRSWMRETQASFISTQSDLILVN